MSCCCGDGNPGRTRITSGGKLEVSYDDGVTWQSADDLDPRYTSIVNQPLPGADGDVKGCLGATSAALVIEQDIITKLQQTSLGISLVVLIAAALAVFLSAGSLAPLVTALVSAALGAGQSAITAAFTPEVWDTFRCILHCRIEDDASFTTSGWQLVKDDIKAQLTGIAASLLVGTVDAFGVVGMTNAARSNRAIAGDCDDCDDCASGCVNAVIVESGVVIETAEDYMIIESRPYNPGSGTVEAVVIVLPDGCCTILSPETVPGWGITGASYHSHRCNGSVLTGYWIQPECLQDVSVFKAGAPTFRIKFTFAGECT